MSPATDTDELFASDNNDGSDAIRENPQEEGANPEAMTYGEDNVNLPEELQNALLCLIQEAHRQELYQRRIEVMRDRRNRFYERGLQHIYEDVQSGIFVQGSPGAWVPDPAGDGKLQCGSYIDDYNIFGRSLQIIIAKLSENPVGIDWQPDSGDDAVDLQAAQAAEAYRLLYDRRNDTKELLTAIVRMMGVSGRTVTWTRTMANEQKWGRDKNGQPRQVQTTTVYGTLESKVPIICRSMEEWPYCILTEDPHIYTAKMQHPDFADKISQEGDEGIADTQFERLARIGALQGNSASFQITDTYNHYVERKYAWFRPSMFMDKTLDSEYKPDQTLRDALREAFPDGCQCTFIGNQYVASRNACMDDELAVDFPYAGDGMSRIAIMDPAVVIQDRFNDNMNAFAEVMEFGWPSTWINGSKTQLSAINDQTAAPYAFRSWESKSGIAQEDNFYREPNPEIPASFIEHNNYLATQLIQFILAIPSAVQGAGMTDQKTASGYTAAIQQAMGQLGVIWTAVQRLMATVYRQAALAAASDDQEQEIIVIPGEQGPITLNTADLGKGHFLAHPDVDSGYPESTMQKRGTLFQLFDLMLKAPQLSEALLQSPDNWDFLSRTLGVAELTFPEARVRRKQLAEIEMLIQQAPIGPSPQETEEALVQHAAGTASAHVTGQPGPPPFDMAALPSHSSITPDPLDFHQWEFEMCQEKLSDWPFVQQQIANGNAQGIQNIRLHAQEHQQYVIQAQQAQMAQQLAMRPHPAAAPAAKPEPPAQTGTEPTTVPA